MPASADPQDPHLPLRVWYGGTFDPVHNGHLAIARAAQRALGCTIRFMPAADPPNRAPPGADARQRAAMVELAISGEAGLCVDRRELARSGRSYSIDTLRELRDQYGPRAPLALLIGADSLVSLPAWKDWRSLLGLAHFVVAERPGSAIEAGSTELVRELAGRWTSDPEALRSAPAGRVLPLQQPLHPGSATEIRRRIAAGESWRSWVPGPVADHIERDGLYGARAPGSGPL